MPDVGPALLARKHYTVPESYAIALRALSTLGALRRSRVGRDSQFRERIMLTVTQVNGCELCSHAHVRFALDAGLDKREVRDLLGGAALGAPEDQHPALAFAQHYADTRGRPEADAWHELVAAYGEADARGVLAAVRLIMWGNAVGIPWSSLLSRLRGTPHPDSSLRYELTTIAGAAALTPVAVVHALISRRSAT